MDYASRQRLLRARSGVGTSRVRFDGAGPHIVGGARDDLVIDDAILEKPIHHFITLDTNDPRCPIESDCFSRLPLFYPLLYGAGGGEIQYSVISNERIKVHHLSECFADDPYVDHYQLPSTNVSLVKLSYGQERLIHALDSHFDTKLSWLDRFRLEQCDGGNFWRVGGTFETCQGPVWSLCRNPDCDWSDSFGGDCKSSIMPIALISASKQQLGDVWDQYSEDVEFFFGFCPHCGAIHAENRCT